MGDKRQATKYAVWIRVELLNRQVRNGCLVCPKANYEPGGTGSV